MVNWLQKLREVKVEVSNFAYIRVDFAVCVKGALGYLHLQITFQLVGTNKYTHYLPKRKGSTKSDFFTCICVVLKNQL